LGGHSRIRISEFKNTHYNRFTEKYSIYDILEYIEVFNLNEIMSFDAKEYSLKVNNQTLNLYGCTSYEEYLNTIDSIIFMHDLDTFDYSKIKLNIEIYKFQIERHIDLINEIIPKLSNEIVTFEKYIETKLKRYFVK